MDGIQLTSWEQKLLMQLRQNYKPYSRHRIDLSIARTNEIVALCGNFLCVAEMSNAANVATIRLNKDASDELALFDGLEINSIFNALYITNAAQAGQHIDIVTGVDFTYKKKIADVPKGTIVAWYGLAAAVPFGWHICDGTIGTPDLRGKAIEGATIDGDIGVEIGSSTHRHNVSGSATATTMTATADIGSYVTIARYDHSHPININSDYVSSYQPTKKFYWIMKIV